MDVLRSASADHRVCSGSDAAGPALGTAWGLSWHHELYLFVKECGFTPLEALTAGTSLTAKCFKWHDRGRIAEGLKADLVLVEGNPLEDIEDSLNLRGVWRDGILAKTYEGKL
jgi:imidazolonepropionase-like amidohydrolase